MSSSKILSAAFVLAMAAASASVTDSNSTGSSSVSMINSASAGNGISVVSTVSNEDSAKENAGEDDIRE